VTLSGSFGRILAFIRTLESARRLAALDEFRIDPQEGSSEVIFKFRVAVYSLPAGRNP